MSHGREEKKEAANPISRRDEIKAEAERILTPTGVSMFAVRDVVSFQLDIAYPSTSIEYATILVRGKNAAAGKGLGGVAIPREGAGLSFLNTFRTDRIIAATSIADEAKKEAAKAEEFRKMWAKSANTMLTERKQLLEKANIEKNTELKTQYQAQAAMSETTRQECRKEEKKAATLRDQWLEKENIARIQIARTGAVTATMGKTSIEEKYTLPLIREGARKVAEAKAGECHSLAVFAVSHLIDEITIKPMLNIKLVAHSAGHSGTHNFILLGFDSDDVSFKSLQAHKNNFVIIDPWLAALGHGQGIFTVDQYPRPHYLQNLKCTYDSATEPAVEHIIIPSGG